MLRIYLIRFPPFRQERDELKDQMLRAVAETENTRRRAERDVAQARKYGHTSFARDLLSVVENLSAPSKHCQNSAMILMKR